MYGMDLFFKAAAMGMKIAQESVENMNSLLEIAAKNVPQAESEDDEAFAGERSQIRKAPGKKSPPAESAKSEDVPSALHTATPPSGPAYKTADSPARFAPGSGGLFPNRTEKGRRP